MEHVMKADEPSDVVLVTGGGRGLGAGICKAFGARGYRVAVLDRDNASAEEVANALIDTGGEAMALAGDVCDSAGMKEHAAYIAQRWGGIHVLINNAGFSRDAPVETMTDEQWHSVIAVCLTGPFVCTRAVAPGMIAQKYGRIINMSSRAQWGDVNKCNYTAAKAGVVGLTSGLALELAEHNITVNAIAPGFCPTERAFELPHYEEIRRRALERTPVQRVGTPDDIAAGALYLASREAGFITGELLNIGGGRYR